MILILSNHHDTSTRDVIYWLERKGIPWFRLNTEDKVSVVYLSMSDKTFSFELLVERGNEKCILRSDEITGYWYRRGKIELVDPTARFESEEAYHLYKFTERENDVVIRAIHDFLKSIPHVGSFYDNDINKLTTLWLAVKHGLEIPPTLVTSDASLLKKQEAYITKALFFGSVHVGESYHFGAGTNRVPSASSLSSRSYALSQFQIEIPKWIELRVFYLGGETYSTAIFSQNNTKTSIDFRNYDHEKPNRVVPHILPDSIHKKVKGLMTEMKMNCGSLDFILTPEGGYIFLEVNPVGQFQQVSIPGGYCLEEKIAQYFERNRISQPV